MTSTDVLPPEDEPEASESDPFRLLGPTEFDDKFEALLGQVLRDPDDKNARADLTVMGDEMLLQVHADIGDQRVPALLVHSVLPGGEIDRRVEYSAGRPHVSKVFSLTKEGELLARMDRTDRIVEDEGGVRGQRNLGVSAFRTPNNLDRRTFNRIVRTAVPSSKFRRRGKGVIVSAIAG